MASKMDFFASSLTSSERSENFNCVEKFATYCVSNGKSDETFERSVMMSPNIFLEFYSLYSDFNRKISSLRVFFKTVFVSF
jgi:hypothetical protein